MSGRRGLATVHQFIFQVGQSLHADRWLPVSPLPLSRAEIPTSTRHHMLLDSPASAAQQAIAADRVLGGCRFAGEVQVRPPLFHSLWSWRPLGIFW